MVKCNILINEEGYDILETKLLMLYIENKYFISKCRFLMLFFYE